MLLGDCGLSALAGADPSVAPPLAPNSGTQSVRASLITCLSPIKGPHDHYTVREKVRNIGLWACIVHSSKARVRATAPYAKVASQSSPIASRTAAWSPLSFAIATQDRKQSRAKKARMNHGRGGAAARLVCLEAGMGRLHRIACAWVRYVERTHARDGRRRNRSPALSVPDQYC